MSKIVGNVGLRKKSVNNKSTKKHMLLMFFSGEITCMRMSLAAIWKNYLANNINYFYSIKVVCCAGTSEYDFKYLSEISWIEVIDKREIEQGLATYIEPFCKSLNFYDIITVLHPDCLVLNFGGIDGLYRHACKNGLAYIGTVGKHPENSFGGLQLYSCVFSFDCKQWVESGVSWGYFSITRSIEDDVIYNIPLRDGLSVSVKQGNKIFGEILHNNKNVFALDSGTGYALYKEFMGESGYVCDGTDIFFTSNFRHYGGTSYMMNSDVYYGYEDIIEYNKNVIKNDYLLDTYDLKESLNRYLPKWCGTDKFLGLGSNI